jgi:tripartite-type tricarboxylate transporter receptor subunit TctC
MQHVPYKGASEVMNGMLNGSVEVMFVTPPSVIGLIKAGTVRALGFTGTKPFPVFPDVPLVKDIVPGFEPIGSWGIFMLPSKTPPELVSKLNSAIHAALLAPAVSSVMQRDGYIPDQRNPTETAAFFRKEVEATGEAVKAAGIEPN